MGERKCLRVGFSRDFPPRDEAVGDDGADGSPWLIIRDEVNVLLFGARVFAMRIMVSRRVLLTGDPFGVSLVTYCTGMWST